MYGVRAGPLRQFRLHVLTFTGSIGFRLLPFVFKLHLQKLTDACSAEAVAEVQTAAALPQVASSTRHRKRQRVQQSIVSMMPQSKAGQAATVCKLISKKQNQDVETVKQVGLASKGRCTRRRPVVVA